MFTVCAFCLFWISVIVFSLFSTYICNSKYFRTYIYCGNKFCSGCHKDSEQQTNYSLVLFTNVAYINMDYILYKKKHFFTWPSIEVSKKKKIHCLNFQPWPMLLKTCVFLQNEITTLNTPTQCSEDPFVFCMVRTFCFHTLSVNDVSFQLSEAWNIKTLVKSKAEGTALLQSWNHSDHLKNSVIVECMQIYLSTVSFNLRFWCHVPKKSQIKLHQI